MHETSLENMAAVRDLYLEPLADNAEGRLRVLDVGAVDVNGSYRSLFDIARFDYVGADLEAGVGVDVVIDEPNRLPFDDGTFDILLSGQMLEHGEFFWETFRDMMRVVDPNGLAVVIAPSAGPIHRYPVDCYRFYPDSLHALARWADVELIDWYHDQRGVWKDLIGVFGHRNPTADASSNCRRLDEALANRGPAFVPPPASYRSFSGPADERACPEDADLSLTSCIPALWPIADVRPSTWTGHIPFMFTVFNLLRPRRYVELGTHHGGSLFAACQARERLGLETECVGIDTFRGDEHSGRYDDSVFAELKQALVARGYTSAVLEQSTFDAASAKFESNSIDLLLIDGLHTYEAVAHDFETWLPKMVPGGVVLFHDTNVHERDFGVWRLWQELTSRFECFEFEHGHGLGVLIVPGAENHMVAWIRALSRDPELASFVQQLYETLGERSASHAELPRVRQASRHRLQQIETLTDERDAARKQLESVRSTLHDRNEALRSAKASQVATADLQQRIDRLQEHRAHLDEQVATWRQRYESARERIEIYESARSVRLVRGWWHLADRVRRTADSGSSSS